MKHKRASASSSSSGITNTHTRISPFWLLNISLYALAALCFMIYTTELHYAHAEGEEDLGSASVPINASVTVGTACNFSGSLDIPHTSTIMNGVNSTDIGKTTMNVTCNDQGGYAIYAIGYTNDEYGNNTLQSSVSDDYNISTSTSTSGNNSAWSMKLATVPGTTTATIENGYNNYNTVPDDYTKVASLSTITDPSTPNTGSSISTTYQTYVSPAQPAGTYSGKVRYTLVHPSNAPKPTFMQDTDAIKSQLTNIGDSMRVIDKRDNKSYWVARLADNNIWMTQDLDLDLDASKTYTPADTDVAANWTPSVSTSTGLDWDNSNTLPNSYDPGKLYWNGRLAENWSGTLDTMTVSSASETPGGEHYRIGNYYNWTAAIAMNDSSAYTADGQDTNQSICPNNWKLPADYGDKSFGQMVYAQGLTSGPNGNIQKTPAYFIYTGQWDGNSGSVGGLAMYWTSKAKRSDVAYILGFSINGSIFPGTWGGRKGGNPIRCVLR